MPEGMFRCVWINCILIPNMLIKIRAPVIYKNVALTTDSGEIKLF